MTLATLKVRMLRAGQSSCEVQNLSQILSFVGRDMIHTSTSARKAS